MLGVDLETAVGLLPHWYHRIELPGGVVTPGWAPINRELYRLPDLTGKRVLDVGAWDGYWTFEALKRGAREVVAIDDFSDLIYKGEKRSWKNFDLCAQVLGYTNRIRRMEASVYNIDRLFDAGYFDVTLFFGVLYHLKHPLLALEKLAAVTNDTICVESAVLDHYSPYAQDGATFKPVGYGDRMVMEFYPGAEYGENAANWWVPTTRLLAHLIQAAGFATAESWCVTNPTSLPECRGFAIGKKKRAE